MNRARKSYRERRIHCRKCCRAIRRSSIGSARRDPGSSRSASSRGSCTSPTTTKRRSASCSDRSNGGARSCGFAAKNTRRSSSRIRFRGASRCAPKDSDSFSSTEARISSSRAPAWAARWTETRFWPARSVPGRAAATQGTSGSRGPSSGSSTARGSASSGGSRRPAGARRCFPTIPGSTRSFASRTASLTARVKGRSSRQG